MKLAARKHKVEVMARREEVCFVFCYGQYCRFLLNSRRMVITKNNSIVLSTKLLSRIVLHRRSWLWRREMQMMLRMALLAR